MNKISLIIKKELYRVFGDRKLIFSLYILPVIITLVMYSLMGKLIGGMQKDIEEHTSVVTIVNASENFKNIVKASGFADNADITYIDEAAYNADKENIDEAIKNGDAELCIKLAPDFDAVVKDYVNGGSALPSMDIYYNNTENYSSQAFEVFSAVVEQSYKTQLLAERYGDISLLNAFEVNPQIICKEDRGSSMFARMMIPYMVIMMLFAGVMSVGVDAISGEKERGTLSSMLISPVKRSEIAIGKMVSMAILSGISATITTVAMVLAFAMMGADASLGSMGFGKISFSPVQCLELLGIMLSLVLFYVGIIALIAVYSTNTKTASSVISPLYIVIILMGMATMFRTGKETASTLYMIPVYGNALAISDICSNELSAVNFLLSFCVTIAIAALLTVLVTRAFNDEKLMFNA